MRSIPLAITLSSVTAVGLLVGMSEAACLVQRCVQDDASVRALAMLGMPLLFAYLLLSWLVVFPAMLLLRKRLGRVVSAASVACLCALGIAVFFHIPSVDGAFVNTAQHIIPWFGTPWMLGGILALTLWPHRSGPRAVPASRTEVP
jgi:hypothetical protein